MKNQFKNRVEGFQKKLSESNIDLAVITNPDSVYYFSGFWGYLEMEFGRPTLVIIPKEGECALITPSLEAVMAHEMSWIEEICEWTDGLDGEWGTPLQRIFNKYGKPKVGIERDKIHPIISNFMQDQLQCAGYVDISDHLAEMRIIKTPEEIDIMRQAGQVDIAMCEAAIEAIVAGVPEYEITLAVMAGGTRKAAEFLTDSGPERLFTPMIHNLQIMQTGPDLHMVHRRPTVRKVNKGESVYLCFCGMIDFKNVKLGFDRQYYIGSCTDEEARLYDITIRAQKAALDHIRPGVTAESVNSAAVEIYEEAGFGVCYRTGRGIGFSNLERPELKVGDKTILKAGMTFAVDGAVSIPNGPAGRVGDSIVVTEGGFEYLTPFPKELRIL